MLSWLRKPYFFINSTKENFLICLSGGFLIFLFLITFRPFGIIYIKNNIFYYTGGFGLVTFGVLSLFFLVFPKVFKKFFKDETFTVGKNILLLLSIIIFISFANWYYNSLVQNTDNMILLTLKHFFIYTFSLAIFPIIILTFLSEKMYRKHREKVSKSIMESTQKKERKTTENKDINIKIFSENNKDFVSFSLQNLVYISSEGNYASLYLHRNNKIEEKLIRNTLTNIDNTLESYRNIIRCHNSYIINTEYLKTISGNARGYYLSFNKVRKQIPVSRKFSKKDLENLLN